jgi:hypothetical protein
MGLHGAHRYRRACISLSPCLHSYHTRPSSRRVTHTRASTHIHTDTHTHHTRTHTRTRARIHSHTPMRRCHFGCCGGAGKAGYLEQARQFAATTHKIVRELNSMPGVEVRSALPGLTLAISRRISVPTRLPHTYVAGVLRLQVIAHPDAAIVAFTSRVYSVYTLVDRAHKKGGYVSLPPLYLCLPHASLFLRCLFGYVCDCVCLCLCFCACACETRSALSMLVATDGSCRVCSPPPRRASASEAACSRPSTRCSLTSARPPST